MNIEQKSFDIFISNGTICYGFNARKIDFIQRMMRSQANDVFSSREYFEINVVFISFAQ